MAATICGNTVCKPSELGNSKKKQRAHFHFGVWLHLSVGKVVLEN